MSIGISNTTKLPKLIIGCKPEEFSQMGFTFREGATLAGNHQIDNVSLPEGWRIVPDPKFTGRDVIVDSDNNIQVEIFPLHAAVEFNREPFMRLPGDKRQFSESSGRASLAPWQS